MQTRPSGRCISVGSFGLICPRVWFPKASDTWDFWPHRRPFQYITIFISIPITVCDWYCFETLRIQSKQLLILSIDGAISKWNSSYLTSKTFLKCFASWLKISPSDYVPAIMLPIHDVSSSYSPCLLLYTANNIVFWILFFRFGFFMECLL